MATLKCEVCGQRVSVYTSRGGTSSYEPEAEKRVKELEKFLAKIAPSWLPVTLRNKRREILRRGENDS